MTEPPLLVAPRTAAAPDLVGAVRERMVTAPRDAWVAAPVAGTTPTPARYVALVVRGTRVRVPVAPEAVEALVLSVWRLDALRAAEDVRAALAARRTELAQTPVAPGSAGDVSGVPAGPSSDRDAATRELLALDVVVEHAERAIATLDARRRALLAQVDAKAREVMGRELANARETGKLQRVGLAYDEQEGIRVEDEQVFRDYVGGLRELKRLKVAVDAAFEAKEEAARAREITTFFAGVNALLSGALMAGRPSPLAAAAGGSERAATVTYEERLADYVRAVAAATARYPLVWRIHPIAEAAFTDRAVRNLTASAWQIATAARDEIQAAALGGDAPVLGAGDPVAALVVDAAARGWSVWHFPGVVALALVELGVSPGHPAAIAAREAVRAVARPAKDREINYELFDIVALGAALVLTGPAAAAFAIVAAAVAVQRIAGTIGTARRQQQMAWLTVDGSGPLSAGEPEITGLVIATMLELGFSVVPGVAALGRGVRAIACAATLRRELRQVAPAAQSLVGELADAAERQAAAELKAELRAVGPPRQGGTSGPGAARGDAAAAAAAADDAAARTVENARRLGSSGPPAPPPSGSWSGTGPPASGSSSGTKPPAAGSWSWSLPGARGATTSSAAKLASRTWTAEEVLESAEMLERYIQERLMPIARKAGPDIAALLERDPTLARALVLQVASGPKVYTGTATLLRQSAAGASLADVAIRDFAGAVNYYKGVVSELFALSSTVAKASELTVMQAMREAAIQRYAPLMESGLWQPPRIVAQIEIAGAHGFKMGPDLAAVSLSADGKSVRILVLGQLKSVNVESLLEQLASDIARLRRSGAKLRLGELGEFDIAKNVEWSLPVAGADPLAATEFLAGAMVPRGTAGAALAGAAVPIRYVELPWTADQIDSLVKAMLLSFGRVGH